MSGVDGIAVAGVHPEPSQAIQGVIPPHDGEATHVVPNECK